MVSMFNIGQLSNKWDTNVKYGEDWLFNLQFFRFEDVKVPLIIQPLRKYNIIVGSISNNKKSRSKSTQEYLKILKRIKKGHIYINNDLTTIIKQSLIKKIQVNKAYIKMSAFEKGLTYQEFVDTYYENYLAFNGVGYNLI